jgi:hypothetical protein
VIPFPMTFRSGCARSALLSRWLRAERCATPLSEFGDKSNVRSAYLVDSVERVVVGELVAPSSIRVWNNLAVQKWAKFGEEIGEIDLSVWPRGQIERRQVIHSAAQTQRRGPHPPAPSGPCVMISARGRQRRRGAGKKTR